MFCLFLAKVPCISYIAKASRTSPSIQSEFDNCREKETKRKQKACLSAYNPDDTVRVI